MRFRDTAHRNGGPIATAATGSNGVPGFVPYVWRRGDRERDEAVAAMVRMTTLTAAVRKAAAEVRESKPVIG